jgi:hypothetical protein
MLRSTRRFGRAFLLAALFLLATTAAHAGDLFYTFNSDEGSGVARLQIDPVTGAILRHEPVFANESVQRARKLAVTQSGLRVGFGHRATQGHNFVIVPLDDPASARTLLLPEEPDEVRAFGEFFLVGGNDGPVWVIDAERAEVVGEWNSRRDLIPSGRQPEDLYVLPGGKQAIVSFQKDSRNGRHLGSRIVVMDLLPELRHRFDIPLPRNRPDLHYDPAHDLREQGPNPEVIFVSPRTNTVILTLDLYGALATFDLDAAVERGKFQNLLYQTTSSDGSWGNTYPDRGVHFEINGREFLLVTNCGPDAGAVMMDVQTRRIIEHYETETGLEMPVLLPTTNIIAAGPNGKIKDRAEPARLKDYEPGRDLHLWDVSGLNAQGGAVLTRIPMDRFVFRTAAVNPASSDLIVVVTGEEEDRPVDLWVYDTRTRTTIERLPALGAVERFLLREAVAVQ